MFFALWYSAVYLRNIKSWMLLGKPVAISMNYKSYPSAICLLIEYFCFPQYQTLKNGAWMKTCVIISGTNNMGSFALIFYLEHFNRSRCFDCFLGIFNVITRNLDKLVTIEKTFILDFWLGSEYTSAESYVTVV